jgi:type II secretory pathway pseudopilin PulG
MSSAHKGKHMKNLRKFLKNRKNRKNSDGFTILEMAVSIPLLALVGGAVVFGMSKSLIIMHENNMAISAGSEVQRVMDILKNSDSCYDLESKISDEGFFEIDASKGFNLVPDVINECLPGSSLTIHIEAIRESNSRVLFETTTKNFIPE